MASRIPHLLSALSPSRPSLTPHPPGPPAKVQETGMGNLLPRPCSYLFLVLSEVWARQGSATLSCGSQKKNRPLLSVYARASSLTYLLKLSPAGHGLRVAGTVFPSFPPTSDLWITKDLCPRLECRSWKFIQRAVARGGSGDVT